MKKLISMLSLLVLASCASRSFERSYKVVDASHQDIPEWINEPQVWADDVDDDDDTDDYSKKNRYYTFSTEAKNSQTISCEIAKARASADLASEITTFIKQSLAVSKQGDPTSQDEALAEYVEDTLAKEVQTFIVGARVYRTYWEKRKFEKELGAKKDWSGFVCSALVKISKANLSNAFDRASKSLVKKSNNSAVKENVQKAMQTAKDSYTKI